LNTTLRTVLRHSSVLGRDSIVY